MKPEGKLVALGNFVKQLALIEIGILGLVGLIWWLAGGRTFEQYANNVVVAGFVIMFFTALSLGGGTVPFGDTRYNYAMTFSPTYDRAKDIMSKRDFNISFGIFAGLSSLITVAIGLVLQGLS
jgi:hypothetical protein